MEYLLCFCVCGTGTIMNTEWDFQKKVYMLRCWWTVWQVLGKVLIHDRIKQKIIQYSSLSDEHEWMLMEEWEQGKHS